MDDIEWMQERIRLLERVQEAAAVIAAQSPHVGERDWMEFYAAVEQADPAPAPQEGG